MTTTSEAVRRIAAGSRRPASLGSIPNGCVSLAMGEPDSGTHPDVVEAAVNSLRRGNTRYSALTGAPALREAIASQLSDSLGRAVSPEEVVPTHGASGGLAAVILALINPGDRVVLPEPTYSLYADHVALAGGTVDWVPNTPEGWPDLEALAAHLPGARMLVVCNPGNPSGVVLTEEETRALGELARINRCLLLSDEAYCDIVFDGRAFLSAMALEGCEDLVVCCRTFSKSYAMTGWRLGYVVATPRVAEAINLTHRTFNGALNTFVQDAALTALALPPEVMEAERASYETRRDLVCAALGGVCGLELPRPEGAFYAFPRFKAAVSADRLTEKFASAGVLVRSGREYGPSGEYRFRISFATDRDTLNLGLERVRIVLEEVAR